MLSTVLDMTGYMLTTSYMPKTQRSMSLYHDICTCLSLQESMNKNLKVFWFLSIYVFKYAGVSGCGHACLHVSIDFKILLHRVHM